MFKKILLLFLILLSIRVNAKEYNVFDMTIDLDETWSIITRDTIKDNEILKKIEISEEEFEKYAIENDVYLSAIKMNNDITFDDIIICYSEMEEVKNLSNYDKNYIEGEAEVIALGMKKEGFEVLDKGSYENEHYKYIYVHYIDSGLNVYFYQTAVNGNAYLIMYISVNKMTEKTIEDFRKNIVDKVKYNQDNTLVEDDTDKKASDDIWIKFLDKARYFIIFGFILLAAFISNKVHDKKIEKNKDADFYDEDKK